MPLTPNFAIPYPCAGDVITATAIADYTTGVDAAMQAVAVLADNALTRPSLAAATLTTGEPMASGVTTTLTFTRILFGQGIPNVVPSTTLTIAEAGVYRAIAQISATDSVTTVTRFRLILNASTGRRVTRNTARTTPSSTSPPIQAAALFVCPAATTFQLLAQWVGTGPPPNLSIAGSLYLYKICDL